MINTVDALQFPRHTESEIMTKEIMHFKTTQKLFKHETEILTRTNLMPSFDSKIISCRSQTGTASTKNSGKAVAKETRQSTEVGDKKNSNSNKQKPNLPNDDGSSSEEEEKKEESVKECGTNKTKRKKKPEKNTEKEQKQKRSRFHLFIEKDVLLANRKNLDNIDDDRTQEDNSMRTKNVPQSVVDSESNKPRQALHSGLTKEQIASTRAEDSTQEGSLKNPTDEKKVDKSVDLKQIIKDISREYIQWTSTKRKRLSEFLKTTAAYNADQFKFIEDTSLLTEMEEKKFIELFGTKQMKTLIAIPVSKTATTATNASASQSTPSITVPDVSKINLNETEAPNPTIDSSPPLYTCSSLDRTQISSPTIGQTVSTPQLPNSRLNRNQVLLERRKQRTDNTESSEDQSSNDTTMRDVPSIPADSAISMIVNTN
uniref:Uncharacterized protein n=1 Tax=Panagrolaimus sp. PS1159 TaxID=55785 RepID=A0AC35F999_9BILA